MTSKGNSYLLQYLIFHNQRRLHIKARKWALFRHVLFVTLKTHSQLSNSSKKSFIPQIALNIRGTMQTRFQCKFCRFSRSEQKFDNRTFFKHRRAMPPIKSPRKSRSKLPKWISFHIKLLESAFHITFRYGADFFSNFNSAKIQKNKWSTPPHRVDNQN